MLVTLLMFYLDWINIIHPKVQNPHEVINGKLFIKKDLNQKQKLCLLNIRLKMIEKKDYPY